MDVVFEIPRGKSFTIEVELFDTVLQIKEKIQKEQNILISEQTLIFNGQLLQDNHDAWEYEIFPTSHIQLIIPKVQLNIKVPKRDHLPLHFNFEMQKNDTVLRLKEILVWELDLSVFPRIPVDKLILHVNGIELKDDQFIRECDNNEIEVSFREILVTVFTGCGLQEVYVKVNSRDKVGELRKKLEELNRKRNFYLPEMGYFFFHKQEVMNDDRSFLWHGVTHGDTIEVFHGIVTSHDNRRKESAASNDDL